MTAKNYIYLITFAEAFGRLQQNWRTRWTAKLIHEERIELNFFFIEFADHRRLNQIARDAKVWRRVLSPWPLVSYVHTYASSFMSHAHVIRGRRTGLCLRPKHRNDRNRDQNDTKPFDALGLVCIRRGLEELSRDSRRWVYNRVAANSMNWNANSNKSRLWATLNLPCRSLHWGVMGRDL